MKQFIPYTITHVYLNEQLALPVLDVHRQGYYLVFWWKEFALGHFFVAPGESLTDNEYYTRFIAAITPAIAFYTDTITNEKWQEYIQTQDIVAWNNWMEDIFISNTPTVVPPKASVSVVICTRNRASQLQRCLQLLQNSVCLPEEIVVVDNAPSDNSTEEVVRQFEDVRYVKEPRAGLDIARNAGVLNAKHPIIAFVDDDVVVHPWWVYNVWKTFDDPETAAMTGLVIASELETEAQFLFERHWSFNRGYTDKVYDEVFFKETLAQGPPVWEIGAGANMAFRKSVFDKVGLFDELLDAGAAGCNGDSEMWYRILLHGFNIKYNPRAVVQHEHRRELKNLKKQIFYYMRGHAAAALIQQQQHQQAGYKKYLLRIFTKVYSKAIVRGFPFYRSQHRTLGVEMLGVLSGLSFYLKHKN